MLPQFREFTLNNSWIGCGITSFDLFSNVISLADHFDLSIECWLDLSPETSLTVIQGGYSTEHLYADHVDQRYLCNNIIKEFA